MDRLLRVVSLAGVVAVGLLMAAVGTASAKPAGGQVPEVSSLLDHSYRSVKTKGLAQVRPRGFNISFFEHASHPDQAAVPTLVFGAGCNSNGSRFRIRGGRLIAFGGFEGTLMGCQIDPDPRIRKLLEKGMKVREVGNRLVLTARGGRVKIVLVEDFPGRPATMESLDGKSFRSTLIKGRKVKRDNMTLDFTTGPLPQHDDQDRQAQGPLMLASIGCNSMGGEYAVRQGRLRWVGETYSTAMMCFPFHDGWLSRLLTKGVKARIAGPVLTLTRGKNRIVLLRSGT